MKNKPYPLYQAEPVRNIYQLLDIVAETYGDRDAYVFKKGKELCKKSFTQLRDEAHALAAYFLEEGLTGRNIAILGENSYEWILAWYGIVLAGNVAVPVDKLLQPEQIAFVLGDTACSAVVHSKQCAKLLPPALRRIDMDSLPAVPGKIVPDTTDPAAPCSIIYTSGTTGIAKGVPLSQTNLCFDLWSLCSIAKFGDRNLFVLPLNHVFAFQGALIFMYQGQTIYLSAGLKRFSQEMKDFGPSDFAMVPLFIETMHGKIMASVRQKGMEKQFRLMKKLSMGLYRMGIDVRRKLFKQVLAEFGGNISTIFCGGAALDVEYIKDFRAFGINIIVGYGITECAPVIAGNRNHYYRDGSCGRPLPGAEFKTDAPDGRSEGELYVRGPMVMSGYYRNEEATREAFDGDWFKTGDYGYIDEDDFIFLTGRKKNIIILSNGKNLYPEELELQLMKEPAIAEVVVYEDDRQVAAEIFPDGDWLAANGITDLQACFEQIIEAFNQKLPPYKTITKIKLRDTAFPKTSSQKIRRNAA